MSVKALLIPADQAQPVGRITIAEDGLAELQAAVGGTIEAVPYHADPAITTYINEEGEFVCEPNPRATQLLGPGLFAGDYIAGDVVVCGFDSATGVNLDCPEGFEATLAHRRRLPEPNATGQFGRRISMEWALSGDADGSFRLALLLVTYQPASIDTASGASHGNQFLAILANRTSSTDAEHGDGTCGVCICREELPGFSQFGLEIFEELAVERLRGLYAKSDPRVTRFFRVASGGAL
jgi:hypothetical protein